VSNFEEANKKIHKVEDQWHYPILIKYGFKPVTKEGVGFIRQYIYAKGEHRIVASTGVNSDHWCDKKTTECGYHAGLEPHLKSLV